jgi:hypothetical protein
MHPGCIACSSFPGARVPVQLTQLKSTSAGLPCKAWRHFLTLLALALGLACQASEEAWNVCVADRPPISTCDILHSKDPAKWSQEGGYAVKLFELAVDNAKKRPQSALANVTLQFHCVALTTEQLMAIMLDTNPANRSCDLVVG